MLQSSICYRVLSIKRWLNNFSADVDRHTNARDDPGAIAARTGGARLSISGGDVN